MIKRQNKWFAVMLVLIVVVALLAAGCSSGDDSAPAVDGGSGNNSAPEADNGASDEPESTRPEVEGERHETETVSMIVADGWDVMDISGGLQAYKGMSNAVEVWVRGSGMTDESVRAAIERFKESYEGSDLFEIEAHGRTYYATTFNFSGMYQTKMGAEKDGMQIEITLAGEDHLDDDIVIGMFDSIIFN